MNPMQKQLVQQTWSKVEPIADLAAGLFYGRLFVIAPATQAMFIKTDMQKQRRMLMQALGLTVKGLDAPDKLIPILEALGRRHVEYGVRDEHYDSVGQALLWTLEQGLGEAFTPPVRDAWTAAYTLVASVMKQAAHKQAA
jgi:hemoglobin-like flavoprotein